MWVDQCVVLLSLISCVFFNANATPVDAAKRRTIDVWVYDDARNPWDGKIVAIAADAQETLDTIQEFLTTSTHRVHDGDLDLVALASIETALYEHFYTLVDLAKDMEYTMSSESMKSTAARIFELNGSMQDLLNLVSKQRKVASGRHSSASAATDPYALSDPFLDMYDELVDMGYSPAAFERWLELAASEASPGTAYEAIATYMLFQPQDTAVYPLNLSAALDLLERAGTASAKVLQTIVRMAVFQNQIASAASTADALLRTHAATNFLARMVLAARLYSHAAAPLTDDDPCEEAVAYYYTSAEDSVQDMIDSGGEKENYEPMLRLSEAWMGMHRSSDDLLEVPLNGMDALDYVRSLALGGNPEAVHRLGEMHFFGDAQAGLAPNPIEALRHFEEAAANGIAHSMANLGLMYANGMGVDPNPERAVQYFQQAADQGNAFAVNGLGYMHWTGQGVAKNSTKAVGGCLLGRRRGRPEQHAGFPPLFNRRQRERLAASSPKLGHHVLQRPRNASVLSVGRPSIPHRGVARSAF
ncbi:hypothetical protein, variant [Aphanomyces invadans]|uniref:Uncharacterized protein n=1 Tax=Aphanomyces invadans TaxID=157072 RepID=A0A024TA81_9STRA|nr:hypothetical protein, variant [Aphanomyces invadans]ETV90262.1 hypothetical protein, variant [Aphanomyces invadans]|eukprot:XP_008881113.1 hypothetical protein, variant [Aphanomyces invadans]